MDKSKFKYSIPTKEELDKIIVDNNIDEVLLATDGSWEISLWLSIDDNILTGIVEISNNKLFSGSIFEVNGKLCESFTHTTRKFNKHELYWILPSAVEECINYIEYILERVKKEIICVNCITTSKNESNPKLIISKKNYGNI